MKQEFSRRKLFKGLAAVAGAAGLTIVASQIDRAPKLLLRSDNDQEYDAWLRGDRKKYWQGTGPMEQLAVRTSNMAPNYRAYLLSQTRLGCQVLYCEMIGIPTIHWNMLTWEQKAEAGRYDPHYDRPEIDPIEAMRLEPGKHDGKALVGKFGQLPYWAAPIPDIVSTGFLNKRTDSEIARSSADREVELAMTHHFQEVHPAVPGMPDWSVEDWKSWARKKTEDDTSIEEWSDHQSRYEQSIGSGWVGNQFKHLGRM